VAALDRDFLEFLTTWNGTDEPGRTAYTAEFLLVTARRR
jgi:2-polyprenyl-6-hydroxyphenyl methylase/3-demethylubiquinone-9 3-methyltransferase